MQIASSTTLLCGSLTILTCGGLTTLKAQVQEHPNGFNLVTPLGLSAGYDKDFIVGSQTVSDTVTLITAPAVAWNTSTHRTLFSVDYQPEFDIFTHNPHLNAWNHIAGLTLRHRFNNRWSLDVGDAFVSTMDSTRTLANSLVLFPWGRFDQNTLYADLTYKMNHLTTLSFRVDSVYTTAAIPELQGGLDNVTEAGTVSADRSLTSRQTVSATYSFIHTTPLDPQPFRTSSNISFETGGYTYAIRPAFVFRATAGGTQGGRQSGFTGSASVEQRVGDLWIGGGYQRYLGFFGVTEPSQLLPGQLVFATGVTPNIRYDTFMFRAIGQLSRRFGLNVNAQRAINGTDVPGLKIRSLVAQIRLDYRISDRVVFFVRADHYGQNIKFFLNQPISRDRYFGGLEIALTRATSSSGQQRRRDKPPEDSFIIRPVNQD